jgi:hypothetical protein
MENPISPADYEQRVDKFANDQQARSLLKMVHTAAGLYFSYMAEHGLQVGSLLIHKNVPAHEPLIHKRIDVGDLYRGGSLMSEH